MASGQHPAAARPKWAADIEITPAFAASLIGEQFPGLRAEPVRVLATGWDNIVFRAGREWLFRFPRRAVAVPGVRREIAALPALAAALPLPVPDPVFAGQPSQRYPWPFFGARLLPGTEFAELPEPRRDRSAPAVGQFLRALGEPAIRDLVAGADLLADPLRRGSAAYRGALARQVLDRLNAAGICPADQEISALLDQAGRPAGPDQAAGPEPAVSPEPAAEGGGSPARPASLVVSHGDLHVRHLLIGPGGQVTGVIDWGDLCLADPAVDLSIAYFGYAGKARAELLAAYGKPVSAARELAARTLAVSLAACLAEYAAAEDRTALLQESLAGLRRAVAS